MDKLLKNLSMYSKKIRCANDNGDFFSYEELKRTYKTFYENMDLIFCLTTAADSIVI
jgi:hypothetical protein